MIGSLLGVLCGALCLHSSWLGLGGIAAMGVALWGLRNVQAWWSATFIVCMLISYFLPHGTGAPLLWVCLILLILGCWMDLADARVPLASGDRPLWNGIGWWIAWALVSLWSNASGDGLKEVGRYVLSFAMLFTYVNWLRNEAQVRSLLRGWRSLTFLTAAVYCFLWLWYRPLGRSAIPMNGLYPRAASELGMLLEMLVPLQTAIWLAFPPRRRWVMGAAASASVAMVLLTGSQAALLATAFGVGAVFIGRAHPANRRRILWAMVLLGLAGVAVVWSLPSWREVAVGQLSGRDKIWAAALQAIREHPLTGIGPGNWSHWFGRHYTSADFMLHDAAGHAFFLNPDHLGGEAHSLWLTKAAEMGILSAVLTAAILIAWFRAAFQARHRASSPWLRAVSTGSLAAMAALTFHSVFENGPFIGRARGTEVLIVWLVAALPLVAGRLTPAGHPAGESAGTPS